MTLPRANVSLSTKLYICGILLSDGIKMFVCDYTQGTIELGLEGRVTSVL